MSAIHLPTLNCTPSTIGSTSPGPESSNNSEERLLEHNLTFSGCKLLLSCRGADEERDPEREDFRILFKMETILPPA